MRIEKKQKTKKKQIRVEFKIIGFNFFFSPFKKILTSANQRLHLVDPELFAKTLLDHLSVNVQLVPPAIPQLVVQVQLPKSADPTPNVELAKLASPVKANVFVEEVTIEILKQEDVKISTNV